MWTTDGQPGPADRTTRLVEGALLAVILVCGIAARFSELGSLPLGGPGSEEGTSWLVTAGQMDHGLPILPSGIAYWKGWPYTLAAAASSRLFGLSEFSLRFPSAIAGAAVILLAWWAARAGAARLTVTPQAAGVTSLLAAWTVAFSEWSILMSRYGRFYALGQALFLAGLVAAIGAFDPGGSRRRLCVMAFGAIAVLAAATFHVGVLLFLAWPVARLMGVRPAAGERPVLWISLALTLAWLAGALFFWKSGHVTSGEGYRDFLDTVGALFWRTTLLAALAFWAWAVIARRERSRLWAWRSAVTVLGLIAAIMAAEAILGLRHPVGLGVIAKGHPGLFLIAAPSLLLLALSVSSSSQRSRSTAALVYLLALAPPILVGGSSGNFQPRYLLFAFGPIAVAAMVGLGVFLDRLSARTPKWVVPCCGVLVPFVLLPSIGPRAALRAATLQPGDPITPLFASSQDRPYVLDVANPARWVAAEARPEDLVVGTNRSIPDAVIGRMDYWFYGFHPSVAFRDESGVRRNLLTGCPLIDSVDELLSLCAHRRIFIIVDPHAAETAEVQLLRSWLEDRGAAPALPPASGRAEVFMLSPGCIP